MPKRLPVTARVVDGEEREGLWARLTDRYPAFDDYQANTDRQIQVIALEPREATRVKGG